MKIEKDSIVYFNHSQMKETVGIVTEVKSKPSGYEYLVETYEGNKCWFNEDQLHALTDEELRYMIIEIIKDEPTKYIIK